MKLRHVVALGGNKSHTRCPVCKETPESYREKHGEHLQMAFVGPDDLDVGLDSESGEYVCYPCLYNLVQNAGPLHVGDLIKSIRAIHQPGRPRRNALFAAIAGLVDEIQAAELHEIKILQEMVSEAAPDHLTADDFPDWEEELRLKAFKNLKEEGKL